MIRERQRERVIEETRRGREIRGREEQECHEKPVSIVITISPLGSIICLIGIPRVLLCLLGTRRERLLRAISLRRRPGSKRSNFRPGVYAGCLEIRESKYMRVCIYGGTRWNKPGENIGKY